MPLAQLVFPAGLRTAESPIAFEEFKPILVDIERLDKLLRRDELQVVVRRVVFVVLVILIFTNSDRRNAKAGRRILPLVAPIRNEGVRNPVGRRSIECDLGQLIDWVQRLETVLQSEGTLAGRRRNDAASHDIGYRIRLRRKKRDCTDGFRHDDQTIGIVGLAFADMVEQQSGCNEYRRGYRWPTRDGRDRLRSNLLLAAADVQSLPVGKRSILPKTGIYFDREWFNEIGACLHRLCDTEAPIAFVIRSPVRNRMWLFGK